MLALQTAPLHLRDQDKERRFDPSLLFAAYAAPHPHHHPRHHSYHHPPSSSHMPHPHTTKLPSQALFYRECDLKQDLSVSVAIKTPSRQPSLIHNHRTLVSPTAAAASTASTATTAAAAPTATLGSPTSVHPLPPLHLHLPASSSPLSLAPPSPSPIETLETEVNSRIQGATRTPLGKIKNSISRMTTQDYYKEKIVLLLTGSFCPVHLHHTEMLEAAKARMEQTIGDQEGALILGGFLSPSHDLYVGEKLKGEDLVLNSTERLDLCRLQTRDSHWIDVDPWEATQDRFYDYHKVTARLGGYLQEQCQGLLAAKMRSLEGMDTDHDLVHNRPHLDHLHNPHLDPSQEEHPPRPHLSFEAHQQRQVVPQRSGSLDADRNPFKIRVVYLCGADFVLRTGARKLVHGIAVVDRPLGAPSSHRRSILLTSAGSISVPVSSPVHPTKNSVQRRVFEQLEQSYGPDWCEASRNNIWWLPSRSRTESEDISSTRIRGLLSNKKSCQGLLHPLVAHWLMENKTGN